jgi:hypothetical protein
MKLNMSIACIWHIQTRTHTRTHTIAVLFSDAYVMKEPTNSFNNLHAELF